MTSDVDVLVHLRATAILVALWTALAQLEWVANLAAFRPGGLFAANGAGGRVRRFLAIACSPRGMLVLTALRLAAAGLLLIAAEPVPLAIGFGIAALTAVVPPLSLSIGDGADKIGAIVAVAGLLVALGLSSGDRALIFAGTLLAGGQLAVCYCVSGVAKLLRPYWRSGRVLQNVLRSEAFGHPQGATLVRHRGVSLSICWTLMLAEALFPLTLFGPVGMLWAALSVFLIFHLATAYFMGLNTFALAFPAAFPLTLLLGASMRTLF